MMYSRSIVFAAAFVVLAPLVCGLQLYVLAGPICPEQVFLDPNACPAQLDASKIAVDPHTNKPCLLAWRFVVEGVPWSYEGKYCDPDSDPMTLTAAGATLTDRKDGTYTISGPAIAAGQIAYPALTLIDKPPAGDAITRKGTIAIIAVRKNNPPSLCGGLP